MSRHESKSDSEGIRRVGLPRMMGFISLADTTTTTRLPLFATGNITWFRHRTKRGDGHNWEGTSCGAESDMLDDILTEVKETGFTISEMVTDKDSSVNSIYCQHFPEGTITYCSNHCAKTLHKELQHVKQAKCAISIHPV